MMIENREELTKVALTILMESFEKDADVVGAYDALFYYIDAMLDKGFMNIEQDTSAHDLVERILQMGDFTNIYNHYENHGKEKVFALGLFAQNVLLRHRIHVEQNELAKAKEIATRLGNQRDSLRNQLEIANSKLVHFSSEIELTRRQ